MTVPSSTPVGPAGAEAAFSPRGLAGTAEVFSPFTSTFTGPRARAASWTAARRSPG